MLVCVDCFTHLPASEVIMNVGFACRGILNALGDVLTIRPTQQFDFIVLSSPFTLF